MTEKTLADLERAIIAQLDPSYDLVYVDYRDELSREQVAWLVRGDFDHLWESTEEFESDARYHSAEEAIRNLADDVIRTWEREADDDDEQDLAALRVEFTDSVEWEHVREVIFDRDTGDWMKQLASQSGRVLLRIPIEAIDEDAGFSFREVTATEVLTAVGFEHTEANVKAVDAMLAECSPEYSVNMGYWIAGADVEAFLDLQEDDEVELINPYMYMGNPFSGSGFITEEAVTGTVRIPRKDLRTDRDAFGYSIDEIFGGLSPSSFEVEMRKVERVPAEGDRDE